MLRPLKIIGGTFSLGWRIVSFLCVTLSVEILRGVVFYAIVTRVLREQNASA